MEAGFRGEGAPAGLPGIGAPEVERGNRMFMERVGAIPGVLRVQVIGDERKICDCSFKIYVDPHSGARERVYDLQCEVFDKDTDGQLEVWVTDAEKVTLTQPRSLKPLSL